MKENEIRNVRKIRAIFKMSSESTDNDFNSD